jgi:hypothetical protein
MSEAHERSVSREKRSVNEKIRGRVKNRVKNRVKRPHVEGLA